MAAIDLTLPPALDRFVRDQVAAGTYPDTATLIQEAILRLMPRAEVDAFRVERFNALVQVGLDQIERGEVTVVDDIEAFFEDIQAEIDAETTDRAA